MDHMVWVTHSHLHYFATVHSSQKLINPKDLYLALKLCASYTANNARIGNESL